MVTSGSLQTMHRQFACLRTCQDCHRYYYNCLQVVWQVLGIAMRDDSASAVSAGSPGVLDSQTARNIQAGRRKGFEPDVHGQDDRELKHLQQGALQDPERLRAAVSRPSQAIKSR